MPEQLIIGFHSNLMEQIVGEQIAGEQTVFIQMKHPYKFKRLTIIKICIGQHLSDDVLF